MSVEVTGQTGFRPRLAVNQFKVEGPGATTGNLPREFQNAHGRPLRVLLIGNIANYAYVTAKMLRRAGVDCVVADPDFYHIMASPEWLETPVSGDWGDDFLPKWSQTTLSGYKRPDWFVQGPAGEVFRILADYGVVKSQLDEILARERLHFARRQATNDPSTLDKAIIGGRRFGKKAAKFFDAHYQATAAKFEPDLSRIFKASEKQHPPVPAAAQPLENSLRETLLGRLPGELGAQFDRTGFLSGLDMYHRALKPFDIVHGFTLSSIFAALTGHPRYCAMELGTLRGLPFEDSDTGRLTHWLYTTAPQSLITNVDCVDAADRLGISPDRRSLMLHAYDVDAAVDYSANFIKTNKPNRGVPFFFAPARHHWKDGNLSWLKGNDVIIRAAGKLARAGAAFELIFIEWGIETGLSRQIITEEGIEDRVHWIKPQARLNLWPLYMRSCAVIDQFQAAAFGGVGLDTMALGRRLISRYDPEAGSRFFASAPPMRNCATVDEVASAMRDVLKDPFDTKGEGARLQHWMQTEHGTPRQLQDLFGVYKKLLDAAPVV